MTPIPKVAMSVMEVLRQEMDTFFFGQKVPEKMLKELDSFLQAHEGPTSIFLQCVLCNDLQRAILTRDEEGILNIGAIVNYLNHKAYQISWGSEENYLKWLRKGES